MMMNSYIVFGTRYCKFDEIHKWVLSHQNVSLYRAVPDIHIKGKYDKFKGGEAEYFYFEDESIVWNERLVASHNNECYSKTIIVLRDLTNVIEDILHYVFRHDYVDRIIKDQIECFEEYTDEYLNETNKCHSNFTLFILYDKWLTDIDYRNEIAKELGFENKDEQEYLDVRDYVLRDKLRFKKHITEQVRELNKRI